MVERRAHTRIYFSLPMEFEVHIPDSDESWASRGVLKNISRSGLYFECETRPQLNRGSVGEFTFTTAPAKCSFINSPIKSQAVVRRIESRVAGTSNFGVAVQFIAGPLIG